MSILSNVFTPRLQLAAQLAIVTSVLIGGLFIGTSFSSSEVKAAQRESENWKARASEMAMEAQAHREHGDSLVATLEKLEQENGQFAREITEIRKVVSAMIPKPETPTELASSLVSRGLKPGLEVKPVQFSTISEGDSDRLWAWSEAYRVKPLLESEIRAWEQKDGVNATRITTLTTQAADYKAWGDGMARSNDALGHALSAQKQATDQALKEVRAEKRKKWLLILGGAAAAYVARGH